MSQLSGKALDLRNSAALLKLARMSVDKMTQPTGKPQAGEHTKMSHSMPCTSRCLLNCNSCCLTVPSLCALTASLSQCRSYQSAQARGAGPCAQLR